MAYLSVVNLSKRSGGDRIVRDVSFDLYKEEMLALLGPVGAGKTAVVRCIAGLDAPDAGEIRFQGKSWENVSPGKRDIGIVFPTYSLYFHMTVEENIGFPLMVRGTPAAEVKRRVEEAAELLGIAALLDRKPKQISGGERQRVAIGRAIVRRPQLFILLEPLTFLDAKLREELRIELRRLQQNLRIPAIFVTSDPTEALIVSDRVAVLHNGTLQQVGTERALYTDPGSLIVGDFFSRPHLNTMELEVQGADPAHLVGSGFELVAPSVSVACGSEVILAFRPEEASFDSRRRVSVQGSVRYAQNLGSVRLVCCDTAFGEFFVQVSGRAPAADEVVHISLPEQIYLFDPQSGRRLK